MYNRDVIAYLKDEVFSKKAEQALCRDEIDQLVIKMNDMAKVCPAEGLATTE